MKCLRCKSHRIMKFVDGFGQSRCYCRLCGRSFLDFMRVLPSGQKSLLGAEVGLYHRPGFAPMR